MIRTLAVLALVLASATAHAQAPRLDAPGTAEVHAVHVGVGAEYAFVAEVGYGRAVQLLGRTVVLGGEVTVPWDTLDVDDVRIRAGAAISLLRPGRWRVLARIAPTVRGTKHAGGRLLGAGADLGVVGGYQSRRWFAGAELGLDAQASTYIFHSDEYLMRTYEGARDGWYLANSGILRAGVQIAVTSGRSDLGLRLGKSYTTELAPTLLPFYATLAYGRRW